MEKLKEKVKMKEKNGEGKVAAIKSVIAEMEDMAGGVVGEMLDMMGKVGLWKGLINHHGTKNKGDLAVENLIEKVEMDRYGPLLRKYAKLVDVGPDEDDDEEDVEKAGDVRNAVVHKGVVTEDEDDEDGDDDTDTDAAEEAEEDLGVDIS